MKNTLISILYDNKAKGAIFCQVNKMNEFVQFSPLKTSGNQKWKGAAPIFNNRDVLSIVDSVISRMSERGFFILKKWIIENNRIEEAIAWVIKYFNALSEGYLFLWFLISGIIERRLISKPIQAVNHV